MAPLEFISSVASTIMSTVVAAVALIFSFRQNVGWRPVALVIESSLSGEGGKWRHRMRVTVEFWNRRKYPVALRAGRVRIGGGIQLIQVRPEGSDSRDFVRDNCAYRELDCLVEPSASKEVAFQVSFENQSLDALRPMFEIVIDYFDPRRNRKAKITLMHPFFYPELGWKKSDEQRKECERLYQEMRAIEARRQPTA